jgi:hypothetical protein
VKNHEETEGSYMECGPFVQAAENTEMFATEELEYALAA